MRSLPSTTPALLHPITLAALALWALNDHVLKGWAPGVLTGKLSDVSALVVCPIVLVGMLEWCRPQLVRERLRVVLAAACVAMGLLAIGLELCEPVMLGFRHGLGAVQYAAQQLAAWLGLGPSPAYALVRNTPDPTDLLCLPALWLPWWLVQGRAQPVRLPRLEARADGSASGPA